MRILVDELPVMASDCIFFCQKDCVINGKECVRMQKEHNETDEDCPFLKEVVKDDAERKNTDI